jgi:type I restriction enzyme, S subunit
MNASVGQVIGNYPMRRLGEVATIERRVVDPAGITEGTTYVGLENIESGGGFVGVREVRDGELASTKFRFDDRHVLFGKLRPYLAKIARPGFSGVCSTDILPVLPGPELDRGFLAHFLLQPGQVAIANSLATGANLPRLSPAALSEFLVPVPSLSEQRRIAAILDQAEALRAQRNEAIAKLHTLSQSIFLDMFGDPVSNPKGWSDPKLGGVLAEQQYGPRFYNESYVPEGIRIVRITDLSDKGELDFDSMPRLAVSDEDRERYCLRAGDVIFARTGATVGKVALIQEGDPQSIAGAYFISMRFKNVVDPAYVLAVLTMPSIREIVARRSRQAAQQNFSGPALRQLPMPLPPAIQQKEFVRRIKVIKRIGGAFHRSSSDLKALFLSLQYRAFRGEL